MRLHFHSRAVAAAQLRLLEFQEDLADLLDEDEYASLIVDEVKIKANYRVEEVTGNGVTIISDSQKDFIEFDNVVLAPKSEPNTELAEQLKVKSLNSTLLEMLLKHINHEYVMLSTTVFALTGVSDGGTI